MSHMSELDSEICEEYLSDVPTENLIAELISREGVAYYNISESESYQIQKKVGDKVSILEKYDGSVQIITISI